MKKNIYSIRLTDKHTTMLHRTAKINNCSRAKIVEAAINEFYEIKDTIIKT